MNREKKIGRNSQGCLLPPWDGFGFSFGADYPSLWREIVWAYNKKFFLTAPMKKI